MTTGGTSTSRVWRHHELVPRYISSSRYYCLEYVPTVVASDADYSKLLQASVEGTPPDIMDSNIFRVVPKKMMRLSSTNLWCREFVRIAGSESPFSF